MMSPRALVLLLIVPFLVLGQSSTGGNSTDSSGGSSTITTTLLSTSIGLGQGRQTTTLVVSQVLTTVVGPTPTGNSTSGNSTSLNSTSSSSTSTTPKNLPTAPTNIDGGGSGGAPSPGKSSPNGIYGPDDGYIAAATTLARNAITGCLIASGIAGALLII